MKSELEVIRRLEERIEAAREKLEGIRAAMGGIPVMDGLPKGKGRESRTERLALLIMTLRAEIQELEEIKKICRVELAEWLSAEIFEPNIFKVMLYRYGFLKKFTEIAALTNFSEASVFRFHRAGILKLTGKGGAQT